LPQDRKNGHHVKAEVLNTSVQMDLEFSLEDLLSFHCSSVDKRWQKFSLWNLWVWVCPSKQLLSRS